LTLPTTLHFELNVQSVIAVTARRYDLSDNGAIE
jgi:hypothetical protein